MNLPWGLIPDYLQFARWWNTDGLIKFTIEVIRVEPRISRREIVSWNISVRLSMDNQIYLSENSLHNKEVGLGAASLPMQLVGATEGRVEVIEVAVKYSVEADVEYGSEVEQLFCNKPNWPIK